MARFELFGTIHLLTMLIVAGTAMAVVLLTRRAGEKQRRVIGWVLVVALSVMEVIYLSWKMSQGNLELKQTLPLHICGAGIILVPVTLIWRNRYLFELVYFWALGGTILAILTPDLRVGFPSVRYFQYFAAHGLLVISVLYLVAATDLRITHSSIKRVYIATLIFAAFVGTMNYILDTNYMFLAHKPRGATLLDYMGPWPWYILTVMGLAVIEFYLLYAPFYFAERRHSNRSGDHAEE